MWLYFDYRSGNVDRRTTLNRASLQIETYNESEIIEKRSKGGATGMTR
jgi:hypothetical protein